MIRPPGFEGVVFGTAAWGDLRRDHRGRADVSAGLGLPEGWAYLNQVHGAAVRCVASAGNHGDGDSLVTTREMLPLMVATADCVPVAIEADGAVALVHAGWRGAIAGVLPATISVLSRKGLAPLRAAIGPAIGPCCYEVGDDVASRFPEHVATTTWGSTSIDVPGFLASQLTGIEIWRSDQCTFTSSDLHSWRRDHNEERQVTVAWLPKS
jgi:YfiH family protein